MPQVVPLQALQSQTITIQLDGQNCLINVYQKYYGLFMDLYLNGVLVIGGVICENLNRIVRSLYLGFSGDFCFIDITADRSNPVYTGLGTQYFLLYLTPADLPSGQG